MPIFRERPALLPRFRAGERDALEAVYWCYVDRVTAVVRYSMRGAGLARRPEQVADLVQDIFARAFAPAARMGFDGVRDYGPYLSTLSRNLLADWARRQGREIPTDAPDLDAMAEPEPADDELDPELTALVRRFLTELTPDLRAFQEVRFERGLSQQATADVLGLTRQTVRTLEQRIRKGLARALKQLGTPVRP
jgi:RNA polymerase sigma-70 factor, ECF subfamily